VDVSLPDGNGLEFVVDAKTVFPDALIIISTGMPLEEMNVNLRAIGKHTLLKKPFDLKLLDPILSEFYGLVSNSFSGSIRQIRLVDLIQMKCLGKDSCRFVIQGFRDKGLLRIVDGQIRYAQTETQLGERALAEMISWKKGSFHEDSLDDESEINIAGSWEFVLMEATQRADECLAIEEK
jgi:response regulator of citrate/malate metabolism